MEILYESDKHYNELNIGEEKTKTVTTDSSQPVTEETMSTGGIDLSKLKL